MTGSRSSLVRLREVVRTSTDLFAVVALVLITALLPSLGALTTPLLRNVAGIVTVLFAPGYAFVSALFPEDRRALTRGEREQGQLPDRRFSLVRTRFSSEIGPFERVALSFALSIALVPLLVISITFTPLSVNEVPVSILVTATTVLFAGIALLRRWRLPVDRQFTIPVNQWLTTGIGFVTDADSRFDGFLNIGLAVAILLSVGTLSFAVIASPNGEQYTNLYVMSENDEGELLLADYPDELTAGEQMSLVFGIDNREYESVNYTMVVQLQRVETTQQAGDTRTSVVEREQLRRIDTHIAHNESWRGEASFEPTITGENLRLTVMLYKGNPPSEPTTENAYRELHLWISVEQS